MSDAQRDPANDEAERAAAERLRARDLRLRLATESAGIGVYDWDVATDTVRWENDRIYEIFGRTRDDGPINASEYVAEIAHRDDVESYRTALSEAIRTGVFRYTGRIRRKDGQLRWVEMTGRMTCAVDGTPLQLTGIVADITERKAAEAEIRKSQDRIKESEQQLRQMTDALPQQVWTARPDGELDYVNAQTRAYAGDIPVDHGIVRWTDVVHPDDLAVSLAAWQLSLTTGVPYEIEQRILHKESGEYRWHLSRALPFRNADGQITRWFGTNTEIDDRKRSEAAVRQARDEAQAANRMKDDFLATLGHELRTPLNAIVGWAKILRSGRFTNDDLEDGLAAIDRNSTAQAQIIEDLLDLSRIVSGNFKLEVRLVNFEEILEAAIATIAPALAAKEITLHKIYDPRVFPGSGDPARLQQVVWNLLANAVKFTPQSGQIHVRLERVDAHVEISVIDTGAGIEPEFLPHVFDRFRQADSTKTRRYGGLGLGLSIVKQLVEAHGGTVRASSPGRGQGSHFTVALPLTVVHPEQVRQEHPRPNNRDDSAGGEHQLDGLTGVKVLIVDDEPDARYLFRRVLVERAADVTVAASAAEGLKLLEEFTPDVIVSDVGMPELNGYDFLRRVRARWSSRELPAAAVTAFARADDRKQALLAGFQTHLSKPVDPAELVAVVASLAGRTGKKSS